MVQSLTFQGTTTTPDGYNVYNDIGAWWSYRTECWGFSSIAPWRLYRYRYHHQHHHYNRGSPAATRRSGGRDDDYVLNQTRLWADADVNEHLRVFIQLQDSRAFGAEGTTVGFATPVSQDAINNNRIDIHQGYFDIKKLFDLPLTVRVGRQEIVWGDHRVIGNFVWSNVGRSFDGGRFMWDTDAIHAEAFAAKVDEDGFHYR